MSVVYQVSLFLYVPAQTMRFTRPGLSESALAAHFEYLCALEGAQRLAYVPVVASGYALCFHSYIRLLLM